jgi:hypothetical protein
MHAFFWSFLSSLSFKSFSGDSGMKNKYQALFWEQNRVAAPAVGMCLLMGGLVMTVTAFGMRGGEDFAALLALATIVGGAAVLLLRNNHEGHLVSDFERRTARLPMHTASIVVIPLVVRLAYLLLLSVLVHALYRLLFGRPVHFVLNSEGSFLALFLLPITFYLAAQAMAWSRKTVTGQNYLYPVLLALLPLAWLYLDHFDRPAHRTYLNAAERAVTTLLQPGYQMLFAAFFFGLAFAGVYLERRDTRVGLPTPGEIWEWLLTRGEAPATPFPSPADAQLWYERKRALLALPLLSGLLLAMLLLLVAVLPLPFGAAGLPRWMPAVALALAALPAALRTLWARSQFTLLRPQESTNIV